jgi:hypothetical protein
MKELPEAARQIIERARDAHDPSDEQVAAMLASLHTRLGFEPPPAVPLPGADAVSGASAASRGLLHAKLLKLALSLIAAGGIGALVLTRSWTAQETVQPTAAVAAAEAPAAELAPAPALPSQEVAAAQPAPEAPDPKPAPVERRPVSRKQKAAASREAVASAAPVTTTVQPAAADVTPAPAPEPELVFAAAAAAPTAPKPAPATTERVLLSDDVVPIQNAKNRAREIQSRGPSDADELTLISRAASRVRDGDHTEALQLLAEHGRKFPGSQLKVERQGLSVLARCGAGQLEQGRREQAAFLRDASQAPLAARVRKACEDKAP